MLILTKLFGRVWDESIVLLNQSLIHFFDLFIIALDFINQVILLDHGWIALYLVHYFLDSVNDSVLLFGTFVSWVAIVSYIITILHFLLKVFLITPDIFFILIELVVDQSKLATYGVSLHCQVCHYSCCWQFVKRLDHGFRVSDEFWGHLRVELVVLDELCVVGINSVLVMGLYDSFSNDVLSFTRECFPVLRGVLIHNVVQMVDINESDLVDHMLIWDLLSCVCCHEDESIMISRVIFFGQRDGETFCPGIFGFTWINQAHFKGSFNDSYDDCLILEVFLTNRVILQFNHWVVIFILNIRSYFMQSFGSIFGIICVFSSTLINFKHYSIKLAIKHISKLWGSFHGIVSQQENTKGALSKRWFLLIVNW